MARAPDMQLSYTLWPEEDRKSWEVAVKDGDPFDDCGPAAHLTDATRRALRESYGRFLGFLAAKHRPLLEGAPARRVDRKIVADYVAWRRPSCGDSGIATDLHHLRLALGFICSGTDWSWLLTVTKRISAQATPKHPKSHLVTSEQLYALGLGLMDRAVIASNTARGAGKVHAVEYRDGLIIALLALIPLRRRTLAALRIGKHMVKSGDRWALDIPDVDSKTKRPLEYPISAALSAGIDLYLNKFRCRIPRAASHDGLWASNQGRPMDDGAIYDTVCRRTRAALGFPVNLHRFRAAAATLWSMRDPANVRGARDLLGHASFGTTEQHYIMAQSRIAGRALNRAIAGTGKRAGGFK
jgi:integrase